MSDPLHAKTCDCNHEYAEHSMAVRAFSLLGGQNCMVTGCVCAEFGNEFTRQLALAKAEAEALA